MVPLTTTTGREAVTETIDQTLVTRGSRYGDFRGHAKITQALKRAMATGRNWERLDDDMREALEMVQHKIGRILNGDPAYLDSWHDIIGYVRMVEQRLEVAAALDKVSDDRLYPDPDSGGLGDPALQQFASRLT
jgi:hypothetical protein